MNLKLASRNNSLPALALTTMDTEELIRKCQAITIREEDKAKITLEVNLKKKERTNNGRLLSGQSNARKGSK